MGYDINKISDVVLAFHSENDSDKLLSVILEQMMKLTDADAGTLYIVHGDELRFSIIKNKSLGVHQEGESITLPPIKIPTDQRLIDNVSVYSAVHGKVVSVDDVYTSEAFNFNGPKRYDALTGYRTKSLVTLPLLTEWVLPSEVIGVIQLINRKDPETGEVVVFGDVEHPPILPALAKVAANTLANQQHMADVSQLFTSIVGVLIEAIDERSYYNSRHTRNVERYVTRFAQFLNTQVEPEHPYYFDKSRLESLSMAALLHDIGKIVTPLDVMDKATRLGDALAEIEVRFEIHDLQLEISFLKGELTQEAYQHELNVAKQALADIKAYNAKGFITDEDYAAIDKLRLLRYYNKAGEFVAVLTADNVESLKVRRGTLTAWERKIMEDHVVFTGKMLDKITLWKYYAGVPLWAKGHHELLDGTGYPLGLKGDQIPTETRMLTIADIFEGITSDDRPYKKAVPVEQTLSILQQMASEGKLDHDLVELFVASKVWEAKDGH